MAEDRTTTASQHGPHPTPFASQRRVSYEIDLGEVSMQATDL